MVTLQKTKKPELLYVWPYLEWGGAQIYFSGIMKRAIAQYSVKAIMPRGSDPKLLGYMTRIGVQCEFFDSHADTSPARSVWQKIRRHVDDSCCALAIARYLAGRDLSHSILHLDMAPWSSFLLLAWLSLRSNVFVTLHSAVPKLTWWRHLEWGLKFRLLCSISGFHLLVSNLDMYESLKPVLPVHFLPSVRLAYTGVDVDEIHRALSLQLDRAGLCQEYELPQDRFLVFSLAQLVPRKGCMVLIEAVKRLRDTGHPIFFVWIGDGAQRPEVLERLQQMGLQDTMRVITPRQIGDDRLDLLRLLRLADLFVHPSFSEGLPGALLEAMALGKPCIASSVNAIPEAITDHESGLLVPPGNSAALAAAIAEIHQDFGLRQRLAVAGQSRVLARFNERTAAETTMRCYESCP